MKNRGTATRRLRAVRLKYLAKGAGLWAGWAAELEKGRWHADGEVGILRLANRLLVGLQWARMRRAGR